MPLAPGDYPIHFSVDPDLGPRNRLTVAFRCILAIPHLILVGGFGLTGGFTAGLRGPAGGFVSLGAGGLLSAAAYFCAFLSWWAILFTGAHPRGLYDFETFVLRWRIRATAYSALFRDEYPPFGEGDGTYAARVSVEYPEGPRDRLSVGLRIFYALPHIVILCFLSIAWMVTSIVAWFAILFTGQYPENLAQFGLNVMRWSTRVEGYMLLLRDEYPPFSLSA
jgi:hypothetical protein